MDLEESKRRMHNGKLYYAGQPELIADQLTYLEKNFDYNQLRPSQQFVGEREIPSIPI